MRYLLALIVSLALCLPQLAHAIGQKNLHTAATAVATGSNVGLDNQGSVGLSVTISGTATVAFEGSADGGVTWTAINCTNISTLASSSTTSATGQFQCAIAGLSHLRAPLSSCSSCTVTVVCTSSTGSLGSTGAVSSLGTATAAAPTLSEGQAASFSFDLAGNARVTLGTLLTCEDQTNQLCRVSGGATRLTQLVGTGGVPSTASDATTTAQTLPIGIKTFHGIVTCTGTCVQTQKIYASFESSATTAKSILVCTLSMNASTTAVDWCKTDLPASYWFVVTSGTSGTTPLAGLFVQY